MVKCIALGSPGAFPTQVALKKAEKGRCITNDDIARCGVFKMARHHHRDLRCVLHPSLLRGYWLQNTSRIHNYKKLNPICCMIAFLGAASKQRTWEQTSDEAAAEHQPKRARADADADSKPLNMAQLLHSAVRVCPCRDPRAPCDLHTVHTTCTCRGLNQVDI